MTIKIKQNADGTTQTVRETTTPRAENIVTYRQPKDTSKTRAGHPETQSAPRTRGTEEAVLTWQGHNSRPQWGNGLKARHGAPIAGDATTGKKPKGYKTGTGGNAQRAIPTGPAHGGHPNTGNPIRTINRAKWNALITRMQRAGLDESAIALTKRVMDAADKRRQSDHTKTVRIDFITESQWRRIDAIRLPKRTR